MNALPNLFSGAKDAVFFKRDARGLALVAGIGFLAVLGIVAAVSYRMVAGENNIQTELRKERVAFYAAEAGLAEARSMMRAQWVPATGFQQVFSNMTGTTPADAALNDDDDSEFSRHVGGICNEIQNNRRIPCLYPLTAEQRYPLRVDSAVIFDGYADADPQEQEKITLFFPDQDNVFFQTFFYDDDDDDDYTSDANRQFWVVSVGEVRGGLLSRPVRVVVRALVTGPLPAELSVGYSGQKGASASKINVAL